MQQQASRGSIKRRSSRPVLSPFGSLTSGERHFGAKVGAKPPRREGTSQDQLAATCKFGVAFGSCGVFMTRD